MPKKGQTEEQILAGSRRVEAEHKRGSLSQGTEQQGDLLPVEAGISRAGRE
jgi:hypothetical protein